MSVQAIGVIVALAIGVVNLGWQTFTWTIAFYADDPVISVEHSLALSLTWTDGRGPHERVVRLRVPTDEHALWW